MVNWPNGPFGETNKLLWSTFPYAIVWNIWKERNRRIFEEQSKTSGLLATDIKVELISWAKIKKRIPYGVDDLIRNCSIGHPEKAGIGGLIRDYKETTIMTFSGPIGICDANEAEIRALLFELGWAYENNQ
ncbi:uncharacterized protein LOC143865812 [Tasmannia lanceolata]|uniref:uncharacterized protein LOC143865433 n=1 Tax=Tasmannia lanceolata TaxID=3420 RepID=UPI0040649DCF